MTIARVEALFAAGFRDVVANIGIENEASLELHDRLGFARSCRFMRATLRELVGRSSV